MKRLILLLGLLFCAAPAFGQITIVERKHATAGSCSSGLSVSFGTNTTAGELIVLSYETGTNGGAATITDSGSQTYTKAWELTNLKSHFAIGVAYVANSASGISSVKVTGTSDTTCNFAVEHVKGIATSSPVDQTGAATTSGQTTPWASPSVTTTRANELLIGGNFANSSASSCTLSASGSWTMTDAGADSNGNDVGLEDQIVSATGSFQATGTTGVCTATLGNYPGIVTFKASGGGGSCVPTLTLMGVGRCG